MLADKNPLARTSNALVIFALLFVTASSQLLAAPDRCTTVIPLTAGETWRDPGRGTDESVCFDLDVETPGILALDLIASSPAAPGARLVFDGPGLLRQSPTSLVTAVPSGIYRARVESEDPRQPLPPFRLASRFSARAAKSELDSETEVEPDPFTSRGDKSETDSETEVEPDPFAHDLSRLPGVLQPHLAELCRPATSDDHGDGFLCATDLRAGKATGEIANDQGDDVDVFRFRVETVAPIGLDVRTDSELVVELYDRHGLPIGAAGSGRDHLRSVRTLVPGVYFFRIRGLADSSGRYSIRLGF